MYCPVGKQDQSCHLRTVKIAFVYVGNSSYLGVAYCLTKTSEADVGPYRSYDLNAVDNIARGMTVTILEASGNHGPFRLNFVSHASDLFRLTDVVTKDSTARKTRVVEPDNSDDAWLTAKLSLKWGRRFPAGFETVTESLARCYQPR